LGKHQSRFEQGCKRKYRNSDMIESNWMRKDSKTRKPKEISMSAIGTGEVLTKDEVQIPSHLRGKIIFDHPLEGECVRWYYDPERNIGILSSETLSEYVELGFTTVYSGGSSVRPPKQLRDELEYPETKVMVYLSLDEDRIGISLFEEERFFEEIDEENLSLG
jgi:hypothetical protein